MANMAKLLLVFFVASLFVTLTVAADSDPINDFCVTNMQSSLLFNGLACKSPAMVTSADFLFSGFRVPAVISGALGVGVTPAFAGVNYPGLNTQGLSLVRFDYKKGGLVPPHTHPRATEVIYCTKGEIYVGFVDTSGKLWDAKLKKGDVWVFPRGLVHFQLAGSHATSVSVLNSQNPGVQLLASALFASTPTIKNEVLSKSFGISSNEVDNIKKGLT